LWSIQYWSIQYWMRQTCMRQYSEYCQRWAQGDSQQSRSLND
jgi:hypothetical protein